MKPIVLGLLLLPALLSAQEDVPRPPLAALAERALEAGRPWLHTQPLSGELGYDYARAGKLLALKPAGDGYEREAVVTLDADGLPFDLLLVSRRTRKDRSALSIVEQMTLRVGLDGKLLAAVRASGRKDEVIRLSVPVDDFYVRQVYEREMAFHRRGAVRAPGAGLPPRTE